VARKRKRGAATSAKFGHIKRRVRKKGEKRRAGGKKSVYQERGKRGEKKTTRGGK